MRHFVISNIYSPKNIGDRAIVEAIIKFLLDLDANASVICLSKYFSEFKEVVSWIGSKELVHLPVNANKLWTFVAPFFYIIKFFVFLIAYRFSKRLGLLMAGRNSSFSLVARSEFVAVAGGNYLFSSNSAFFSRTMIVHLLNIYFPVLLGKDVYIFPQSIGPFYRKYEAKFAFFVLSKAKAVMVRDNESYQLLINQGFPKNKVFLIPDIAFLHASELDSPPPNTIRKVLITALDWSWGVALERKGEYANTVENYKTSLSEVIDYLASFHGVEVTMLSQVRAKGSDDMIITKEIASRAHSHINIVDLSNSNLKLILEFYREFDLIIGSRMHSCILGLCQGIPTIGLSYQPKGIGLYKLLGLDQYSLDANHLSARELRVLVNSVFENYPQVHIDFNTKIRSSIANMRTSLNAVISKQG